MDDPVFLSRKNLSGYTYNNTLKFHIHLNFKQYWLCFRKRTLNVYNFIMIIPDSNMYTYKFLDTLKLETDLNMKSVNFQRILRTYRINVWRSGKS